MFGALRKKKENFHHTAEGCRELEGKTNRKKMRKYLERRDKEEKNKKRWRNEKPQRRKKVRGRTVGQTETERWFKIAGGWKLIFRAH